MSAERYGAIPDEFRRLMRELPTVEFDGVIYVTAADHCGRVEEISKYAHYAAQMFAEAIVVLEAARAEIILLKGDI